MRQWIKEALHYRTVKLVEIRNWKLGLLHRTVQVAILGYVIGFVILWRGTYLSESRMVSSFVSKVKGSAYVIRSNSSAPAPVTTVYDAYDLVQPPLEQDGLFLTLKMAATSGQKRGVCSGNYDGDSTASESCRYGCDYGRRTWNGVTAGSCDYSTGFCFIDAWCPPELPDVNMTYLVPDAVDQFTIFIKVNVAFADFGIVLDNVGSGSPVQCECLSPLPSSSFSFLS